MDILLATNNQGKVERFKRLLAAVDPSIVLHTPAELGLVVQDVKETESTLLGNAELKVRAYAGMTELPILANDTGFWVEGEGFVSAPKRFALGGASEADLTLEELSTRILEFWKSIATKHGGEVDAAWEEVFVVLLPDGTERHATSRREVTLTNTEFATPPLQMPIRCLYRSKTTNKPAILHTEEEELLELEPITNALQQVLL